MLLASKWRRAYNACGGFRLSIQTLPQGILPGTISLVFGHSDAGTLPVDDLFAAAEAVLRGPQARPALAYGAEQGVLGQRWSSTC